MFKKAKSTGTLTGSLSKDARTEWVWRMNWLLESGGGHSKVGG